MTNSFPEAKRLVRRRAVLVIARRALVRLVRSLRQKKEQEGDGRSFMELILDAASNANGNLAKVVGTEQGAYLQLQDEIASTRAGIDDLRKEVGAEMSAMKEGINRLLAKEGLAAVERVS